MSFSIQDYDRHTYIVRVGDFHIYVITGPLL